MQAPVVSALLVLAALGQRPAPVRYGTIQAEEISYQKQTFKQWWGDELVMKFDDLPTEGKVPAGRVPYAGHDYPDKAGGTTNAMYKYDRAFHGGNALAAEYERMDVSAHRNGRGEPRMRRGLFGRIRYVDEGVPSWYGHCNGWTAAAIRHAEPQKSVIRNGVTFTPADIKGLLAELYMYADSEFLGGVDPAINPATLHLVLSNWLGRGSHPVGMETAVGEVVINYPVFAYRTNFRKVSDRQVDVRTTIAYTMNINREMDKGPEKYHRNLSFHYGLDLDESGEITGGRYYGDSNQIDMLWTPLQPYQGGHEKNKRGNPHLNVKEVLAIWRESVPEETRLAWLNVDPTEEDRIFTEADKAAIAAAKEKAAAEAKAAATAATSTPAASPGNSVTATPASSADTAITPTANPSPAPASATSAGGGGAPGEDNSPVATEPVAAESASP